MTQSYIHIRLRRDTAANWTANNPILKIGEPGLETDTRKLKFGDGVTPWNSLQYSGIDINDNLLLENIDDRVAALIKAGSNISIIYNDNTNELIISAIGLQLSGNYATLVDGKIPSVQLPSYVDDVLEYANLAAFPVTGETSKIYVTLDSNKTYRWGGSSYIEISSSPGSTDSIAEGSVNLYFTNQRASDAAPVQSVAGRTGIITLSKSDVGLSNVDNTSDLNKPVSTAQASADSAVQTAASDDATAKANAAQAYAVQREHHTGTQDASTIGSGKFDFERLPFTITYPIRAVHVGGSLGFNNWQYAVSPTYYWNGATCDLLTLATMEYPATSVFVDVSASVNKYITDYPGRTLNYASLEVALIDASNRVIGWGATSTSAATHPSNGLAGTSMTVSLFTFPSLSNSWILGGNPSVSGTRVADITPITQYKKVTSRFLDIEKHDWANIVNQPTTDGISEGSINKYYTDVRASAASPVQSVAGRIGAITLTKNDVQLNNVDNTSDADKPVSAAQAAADDAVASAAAADATGKANAAQAAAVQRANHTGTQTASTISDFSTAAAAAAPVQSVAGKTGTVTLAKGDVGLGNVDNTADSAKPVSTAQAAADAAVASAAAADATSKANAAQAYAIQRANHTGTQPISTVSGLQAALDSKQPVGTYATLVNGLVPSSQLPSYVDDVIEAADLAALPGTGEAGKIYVTIDSNKTYRWSGTTYVEISASPGSTDVVPEGSVNLYYTNARASAAAPVQSVAGKTGTVTLVKADVGLSNVDNTSDASKPVSTAQAAADAAVASAAAADATSKANAAQAAAVQRANHTGTQTASTISDFAAAVAAAAPERIVLVGGNGHPGEQDPPLVGDPSKIYLSHLNNPKLLWVYDGEYFTQLARWDDYRLSDARTPTAHKASHATGGSDALTPADIGAAALVHSQTASTISDFAAAVAAAAPVQSVAGRTGNITLNASDIQDLNNAISSELSTQILSGSGILIQYDNVADTVTISSTITKNTLGLSNVDNTSDLNKPVSTAQALANTAVQNAAATDATTKANAVQAYAVQRGNHTGTQLAATISDFAPTVSGLLPVKNIVADSYISVSNNNGTYTISATGVQPSGNYVTPSGLIAGVGLTLTYNNLNNQTTFTANGITPILDLGAVSGSNAINYGSDRAIQTLSLNGTATTFTKGTGWPSAGFSGDVVLMITVSVATSITWTVVNDWYSQPAAGALSIGTHIFLLRSIGSSIIQGHYIGSKTN